VIATTLTAGVQNVAGSSCGLFAQLELRKHALLRCGGGLKHFFHAFLIGAG